MRYHGAIGTQPRGGMHLAPEDHVRFLQGPSCREDRRKSARAGDRLRVQTALHLDQFLLLPLRKLARIESQLPDPFLDPATDRQRTVDFHTPSFLLLCSPASERSHSRTAEVTLDNFCRNPPRQYLSQTRNRASSASMSAGSGEVRSRRSCVIG